VEQTATHLVTPSAPLGHDGGISLGYWSRGNSDDLGKLYKNNSHPSVRRHRSLSGRPFSYLYSTLKAVFEGLSTAIVVIVHWSGPRRSIIDCLRGNNLPAFVTSHFALLEPRGFLHTVHSFSVGVLLIRSRPDLHTLQAFLLMTGPSALLAKILPK
jgi:hypothetical protein